MTYPPILYPHLPGLTIGLDRDMLGLDHNRLTLEREGATLGLSGLKEAA
ncbi:MAG: hypothetical protein JSW15_09130 [Deltaproteobacteria bacterium]|nr:MAG: hypothetical protein JSW15_09130 [Deltaproteobacteria bacterium]